MWKLDEAHIDYGIMHALSAWSIASFCFLSECRTARQAIQGCGNMESWIAHSKHISDGLVGNVAACDLN